MVLLRINYFSAFGYLVEAQKFLLVKVKYFWLGIHG